MPYNKLNVYYDHLCPVDFAAVRRREQETCSRSCASRWMRLDGAAREVRREIAWRQEEYARTGKDPLAEDLPGAEYQENEKVQREAQREVLREQAEFKVENILGPRPKNLDELLKKPGNGSGGSSGGEGEGGGD